jgi:release factor glutamine methyltransferase
MTLSEAQRFSVLTLQHYLIESPLAETQLILESLGFSSLDIAMKSEALLSAAQETRLNQILERRIKREPLQHILGYTHFFGLRLNVTPDVLIPRPETERLVEIALEILKDIKIPKVMDIGTGSGAIALVIKQQRPNANVMATDISKKALELAAFNAKQHHLEIRFVHSDLLSDQTANSFAKQAHLMIANLPYLPLSDKQHVSPEVLHDPDTALYAGEDGLDLVKTLMGNCPKPSQLLLELDPRNIHAAFTHASAWKAAIYQDLTGRDRFLYLTPKNL